MRVAALAFLFLASPALAAGPTVRPNCTASWSPVTTTIDGSPIPSGVTVTYNLYLSPGTPASHGAVSQSGIPGTSVQPCGPLSPGQYTVWVSAVANQSGSAPTEGDISQAFPFVLIRPGVVTIPAGIVPVVGPTAVR